MKHLDTFLTEKEKEKSSAPKPTHPDAGADDELYIKIMMDYKKKRRGDREESGKLLDKAEKLMQDGDVSNEAILAAAYL